MIKYQEMRFKNSWTVSTTLHDLEIPNDPENRHRAQMLREIEAGEAEVIAYVEPVPHYADLRRAAYGQWGDQLDMQYHDSVDDTTTWVDHVAGVKAEHPKP
jgi:hypothetical protein